MEHRVVLRTAIEHQRNNENFYHVLISQDFTHLVPFERVEDFNPGHIEKLLFQVHVFKVKKELKKKGNKKYDLPELPRQVQEGTQMIQFGANGRILENIYRNKLISKRTLTDSAKPYSLWEYVIADETTWTVLHHYALKKGKRLREEDEAEVTASAKQIHFAQDEYQPVATELASDMTYLQFVPEQDYIGGEAMTAMDPQILELIGDNGLTETLSLNYVDDTITNEYIIGEDQASHPSVTDDIVSNVMQEDVDHLLPYIPTHMYYQLLNKSISEKMFFNVPIQVHEELFRFKFKCIFTEEDAAGRITESEVEEVLAIDDLTRDNFEFIIVQERIHIVSPAGTGKTMAMLQLAKSFEREQHNLVTVVCKAEYFWRDVGLNSSTMLDSLVNSSMITADIREHNDQAEWQKSLSRVIKQGTGVILLLDAVDEMKSQEREDFLNYLEHMSDSIPGPVQDVNIVALVVSSRPGVELPNWIPLKMAKVKNADHVLQTLCADNTPVLERARLLQQNFKFPQTLFWYSLLAIEARRLDPDRPLANSQFDFLGEMLLQSIKVMQQKKGSLDDDQRDILSEDPTVLLQVAALVAYIAKRLGTTRIIDIEPYLSSLILTSSFPPSLYQASGEIIKKLLPFYQFCHCCYSCAEDSTDKFVKFDHQIIWDYLTADFIVKTIVKKSHPSLLIQLDQMEAVNFEWRKYIELSGLPNSEWAQPLHLVAEALPVTQFITTIKSCDEQQAIAWVTKIINHPRCSDVADRSLSYVKLFVSCLFNASKKSAFKASETHQQKKLKETNGEMPDDDELTVIGFDLALKLFGQPSKGQFNFEEICTYKSLAQFLNEIALRGRNREFVKLFVQKFDSNEPREPEELISFVKQIRSDFDIQLLMEGLFDRMSSKCAEESLYHPMRKAIHKIFAQVIKEDRCFDFLLEKLANMDDASVQASAMTILMSFPTLSVDHVRRMLGMIQLNDDQQRVITALPRQLPLEVFDDMKNLILTCESTLWSQIIFAFERFSQESQECYDKFFTLFDYFKTYIIAKRKFTQPEVKLTPDQIAKLTRLYQDPAAFYQQSLEEYEIKRVRSCVVQVVQLQELTEEQKKFFDLLPKPRPPPSRRFKFGGKLYEADTIENYLQSFCSSPITKEQVVLLGHRYLPYYVTKPEPALRMLEHIGEQFRTVLCPTIPEIIMIDDFYRGFFDRTENHLVAADAIIGFLSDAKYPMDNNHIAQLLALMTNNAVNLRRGVRDEWHSLIKLVQCQKILLAVSKQQDQIKWSVDNMVALWKLLGTVHYHTCSTEFFFPETIPEILHNWTQQDVDAFLDIVADLESGSKLQYAIEQSVTNLLKDKR